MAKPRLGVAPTDFAIKANLQSRFGYNLRVLRKDQGLSQTDLANLAGIAQRTISMIENGQVNLTLLTMQRLAKAVDHDVVRLLTVTHNPSK